MGSLVGRLLGCMLISLLMSHWLCKLLGVASAGPREDTLLITGSRSHQKALVQGLLDGGAAVNTVDGLGRSARSGRI
ncbi:MAG: hypothetical protein CMM33_07935 [Rhodospirillaceae bacterium]|nr:hypothetical protein [Rhodospirillaceae bacterium]